MRKLAFSAAIIFLIAACGGRETGELIGVTDRPDWYEPDPYGMVFIPMGSFNMGPNDEDVPFAMNAKTKTVSVDPFWMDETEITNNEYRQFVHWVRDSIARTIIFENDPDSELMIPPDPDAAGAEDKDPLVNWEKEIPWENADYRKYLMNEDFIKDIEERVYRSNRFNTHKFIYEYSWFDLKQAAKRSNRFKYDKEKTDGQVEISGEYDGYVTDYFQDDPSKRRKPIESMKDFIIHDKEPIYPDTLVWMSDYTYSYNEPWTNKYFWHVAFDKYPVVGVTWKQARAFSVWRTRLINNYRAKNNEPHLEKYRLPTEAEWEYAARGGLDMTKYPWGGPYTRNNKGCFIANFKPMRGNYAADGGTRTLSVMSYEPNEWGLYDMAGNVAEWTSSAYDESSYRYLHDLNPDYRYHASKNDPPVLKRKVIRGGSWKDIGYYLQNGVRTYEYQDTAKSYVGFRCVRSYLGRDAADWNTGTEF